MNAQHVSSQIPIATFCNLEVWSAFHNKETKATLPQATQAGKAKARVSLALGGFFYLTSSSPWVLKLTRVVRLSPQWALGWLFTAGL